MSETTRCPRLIQVALPIREISAESVRDITLKDVETVQGDPTRVREWVKLTRRVIDEVVG